MNLIIHARRDREEAESLYRQMVCDGFDDVRLDEDLDGEDSYGWDGEEMQGPHE